MNFHRNAADHPARKSARSPANPLAYRLTDASAVTGLSTSTLYRHARTGRLQLVRVGGRTLVDAASLRAVVGAG